MTHHKTAFGIGIGLLVVAAAVLFLPMDHQRTSCGSVAFSNMSQIDHDRKVADMVARVDMGDPTLNDAATSDSLDYRDLVDDCTAQRAQHIVFAGIVGVAGASTLAWALLADRRRRSQSTAAEAF